MKIVFIFITIVNLLHASSSIQKHYSKSKTNIYQPISYMKFLEAKKCFKQVFLTLKNHHCLSSLEFKLTEFNQTIIIEDKKRQGGGFFIIRDNPKAQNMLSIPHRFSDTHTGNIGFKMMNNDPFKASAFSTVHRKTMDIAHNPYNFFTAFHLAFASLFPKEFIYQLHGFSNKKRKESLAQKTSMITSTGSKFYSHQAIAICQHLKLAHKMCLVYGKTTHELGGTTNAQRNLLNLEGFKHFIHIEMNKSFRTELLNDTKARQIFSSILLLDTL